jgi:hypothetical protein
VYNLHQLMAPLAFLVAIAWMIHSAAGLSERQPFENGNFRGTGDRVVVELPTAPTEKSQDAVDVRSFGVAVANSKTASLKDSPDFGVDMGLLLEPDMQQEHKPMPAWPKLDKLRAKLGKLLVTWGLRLLYGTGDHGVDAPTAAPVPIAKALRSKIDLQKVADKVAVDMRSSAFAVAKSINLPLDSEMPHMNSPVPVVMPAMLPAMLGVVVMSAILLVTLMLRMACNGPTKESRPSWKLSIEWA